MDFIARTLTNARPPKSTEKTLTTSPTKGTLKLSEAAGSAIGVTKGDFLAFGVGKDGVNYLYKGSKGTDGKSNVGAKLATANDKKSGTLNFSSANVYQTLKGNKNSINVYIIGEAVNKDGVDYFPLTFKEEVAKQIRKKGEAVSA